MGLVASIQKAIDDHKEKIKGPHFIFSAEAPKHPNRDQVKMGHDDVLSHLQKAGYDAHTINASSPAKGILIYGVTPQIAEALHKLCGRMGQESSVYSDGQNHEIRYHHGENEGKSFKGSGTQFYDKKPEGPHSSLPGETGFFHHNLDGDFQKSELIKGAMQRIARFNPQGMDEHTEETLSHWQGHSPRSDEETPRDIRNEIGHDGGAARMRFLHKLSGQTKIRRAADGKREFLLHRGMGREEAGSAVSETHTEHNENSSWTPRADIAGNFKENGGNISSSWIHENHILTVPKQYGKLPVPNSVLFSDPEHKKPKGENKFAPEHEVIVGPHRSPNATFNDLSPAPNIHDKISVHSKAHFQKSETCDYAEAKLEALLKAEDKSVSRQVKQSIGPGEPTEERRQVPRANSGAPPKVGVGVHESYKQNANQGANVMWRAKIKGRKMLAEGIPLHMTLKTFNDPKDIPLDEIHQKVNQLGLERPDPKQLRFEPTIFNSQRDGKPYYMLKIHGTDPRYQQFYDQFKGSGVTYPQFMGHVTIDKDLYDQIKREGIDHNDVEFSPLMIEHGANNPTHMFQDSKSGQDHKSDVTPKKLNPVPGDKGKVIPFPKPAEKHKKLAASEPAMDSLAKGSLKNAAMGLGAAAAMAASPSHASIPQIEKPSMEQHSGYDSKKMLNAIAQVESTNGQNTNHALLGGLNSGERAYGKYGLTPETIRETVSHNKDLKGRYGPLTALKGDALHHFMHDNPGLEDTIAQKHLQRLEHHFGQDPEKLGFSWLNGVRGTYKAAKNNTDFKNHWHVKKIMAALRGNGT